MKGNSRGFTLIETLVAISVLSIALVVILQLFAGGLKSAGLSNHYTRAVFHAREKMEDILLNQTFEEGTANGSFEDRFEWKSEISRLEQREEERDRLPFDMYGIKLQITWHEGGRSRHIEVRTMKLTEKKRENV